MTTKIGWAKHEIWMSQKTGWAKKLGEPNTKLGGPVTGRLTRSAATAQQCNDTRLYYNIS